MSSFTTPLLLSPTFSGLDFVLMARFEYCIGAKDNPWRISVPAGFRTDMASVPRILWAILPPHGQYGKAAVVHDYLYVTGLTSRAVADAIFYEAMLALKVPKLKAAIIYLAVRIGGRKPWDKRREIV